MLPTGEPPLGLMEGAVLSQELDLCEHWGSLFIDCNTTSEKLSDTRGHSPTDPGPNLKPQTWQGKNCLMNLKQISESTTIEPILP